MNFDTFHIHWPLPSSKLPQKPLWKKMLTLRRNIRLTSLCFLCFSSARLSYPQTALSDHMVWTTMVKPLLTIQLGRAGSALRQILKRAVRYRNHYNLPPLCWETEQGESSPVPCQNIICLGWWALASPTLANPRPQCFPVVCFPKPPVYWKKYFCQCWGKHQHSVLASTGNCQTPQNF